MLSSHSARVTDRFCSTPLPPHASTISKQPREVAIVPTDHSMAIVPTDHCIFPAAEQGPFLIARAQHTRRDHVEPIARDAIRPFRSDDHFHSPAGRPSPLSLAPLCPPVATVAPPTPTLPLHLITPPPIPMSRRRATRALESHLITTTSFMIRRASGRRWREGKECTVSHSLAARLRSSP